mgnify:CR=1 FL=1
MHNNATTTLAKAGDVVTLTIATNEITKYTEAGVQSALNFLFKSLKFKVFLTFSSVSVLLSINLVKLVSGNHLLKILLVIVITFLCLALLRTRCALVNKKGSFLK